MAHPALGIDCPTCIAKVGEMCITVKLDEVKTRSPHQKRVEAVKGTDVKAPESAPSRRTRALPETIIPPDSTGPHVGDYVQFRDPDLKTHGHTGRMLAAEYKNFELQWVMVRPSAKPLEVLDIDWENTKFGLPEDRAIDAMFVDGWWPAEETPKSPKTMRAVKV